MKDTLCKRTALGGLLQGYFHNLRGTLQSLSLELQMLLIKKKADCDQEIYERINKALLILQKLQNQIDTAFDEVYNENPGPWNLKNIIEKEILFWEAFLEFKHKVKKEIIEEEKVLIEIPYNLLRGLFCNIAQELFLNLKENAQLKIFIKKDKKIEFLWNENLNEKVYSTLKKLAEIFLPIAKIQVNSQSLSIQFN